MRPSRPFFSAVRQSPDTGVKRIRFPGPYPAVSVPAGITVPMNTPSGVSPNGSSGLRLGLLWAIAVALSLFPRHANAGPPSVALPSLVRSDGSVMVNLNRDGSRLLPGRIRCRIHPFFFASGVGSCATAGTLEVPGVGMYGLSVTMYAIGPTGGLATLGCWFASISACGDDG